jgi:hypothetical protein
MTYNMEGSEIYRMAQYMENYTQKLLEKNFKMPIAKKVENLVLKDSIVNPQMQVPINSNTNCTIAINLTQEGNQSNTNKLEKIAISKLGIANRLSQCLKRPEINRIPLQEKIDLHDAIGKLNDKGIQSVLKLVHKECPYSLEQADDDKLQIRFDLLCKDDFTKVKSIVYEQLDNMNIKKNN